MNEESQIALSVAILEEEIAKVKVRRNKSIIPTDTEHYNTEILGYVKSILALRSYLNPDLDE